MENLLLFFAGVAAGAYFSDAVKDAVPILDKDVQAASA